MLQNLKNLAYAQSRLLHKHEDDAEEFEMVLAREGRALIDELHKLAKFGYGRERETYHLKRAGIFFVSKVGFALHLRSCTAAQWNVFSYQLLNYQHIINIDAICFPSSC